MNTKNSKNHSTPPPKKPQIDKNKLLAYILIGLMVFWSIASIFSFIAYGRSTKRACANGNLITANADSSELSSNKYSPENFSFAHDVLTGFTLCKVSPVTVSDESFVGTWLFDDVLLFTEDFDFDIYFRTADDPSRLYKRLVYYSGRLYGYYLIGAATAEEVLYDDKLDEWKKYDYRSITVLANLVGAEDYSVLSDFFLANADFIANYDKDYVTNYAVSTGPQRISFYDDVLYYNDIPVSTLPSFLDEECKFNTTFIFSDRLSYDIPCTLAWLKSTGVPPFSASHYDIMTSIDCGAAISNNVFAVSYTVNFSRYSNLIVSDSTIKWWYQFIVYYDFEDYLLENIDNVNFKNYIYFPLTNERICLDEDEVIIERSFEDNLAMMDIFRKANSSSIPSTPPTSPTGDYSFFSLLSAVIDVPIQTFVSLFDLEVLGINLSSFFLALLSCAACIAIIRLIL